MAEFVAWQRPAVYAMAGGGALVAGRLAAELPVTLDDGGGALTAKAPFLLAGPGDVADVVRTQITGRRPFPGNADAEITMMAHVELASPDLPWRYSPVPGPSADGGIRPWLVLVVGTPAEVTVAGAQVTLAGAGLFAAHDLDRAQRWAHVHDVPGRRFARIISPRELAVDTVYVAVLVPCWRTVVAADGATSLEDSWTAQTANVTLRCFDAWTFRTRDDPDDFASIAKRLDPLTATERQLLDERGFGRAAVAVGPVPGDPLATAGALARVPAPGEALNTPLPAEVADAVGALTGARSDGDRWVLTLPRYDVPWHPGPVDGEDFAWPPPGDEVVPDGWRRELRVDPRHRGAAGLGAWIAIAWQDRIATGAARQVAAVAAAAQRIRHLAIGLGASRHLWARRVPADPVARLATLSPLLGRLPADGGGTALGAIGGRTPALSPALLSSAARRALRRRGPLARAASPGATSLAGLITAANRCPDPQRLSDAEVSVLDVLADPDAARQIAGDLRERGAEWLETIFEDGHDLADAVRSLREDEGVTTEIVEGVAERTPEMWCRPIADLDALAGSIADAIDPTVERPMAVERVLGTITGLRAPWLAEPDVAPELDIPLWSFLSKEAPDWLLPGAGDIPVDRVLAVQTNPTFTDAVLIGANTQTIGELRWRNIPITTRWTPLRRFWQRIDVAGGSVAPDIREVVTLATDQPLWTDASVLGDVAHLADPDNGTNLVVVLHTELFRRYPSTIVYATPNAGGADVWGPAPAVDDPVTQPRVYPTFSGTIGPELVFFGFPVPPSAGRDHWIVLEEPPPGYRFAQRDDGAGNGATFARDAFAEPVRVCFGNLLP